MMAITATLGNVVRIGPPLDPPTGAHPIYVRDIGGALVNPTTITVTVKRPDGTTAAPATPTHYLDGSSNPIVGTFYLDYEPAVSAAMVGEHEYRVATTNPDAAYEGSIFMLPSPFI